MSTVIPQIGSVATFGSRGSSETELALRTRTISAATLNAISGNVSLPSSTPAGHFTAAISSSLAPFVR